MGDEVKREQCQRRHRWELLPVVDTRPWTWCCTRCGMLKKRTGRRSYAYRRPPTTNVP